MTILIAVQSVISNPNNFDMRYLLIVCTFFIFSAQSCNTGYKDYQKVEGVSFGYKWAEAKNDAGEKVPALLLQVANENDHAIEYALSVDFYYEGVLRESGELNECVEANKTRKGKLNGVYLISENFTSDQINNSDFMLELNDIAIEEVEECSSEEE